MRPGRPRLLFVGNFLSATLGRFAVCEALSSRLRADGWTVLTASARAGRAARLAEMLHAVARHRHDYDVAHVDVFSGAAFLWAELVGAALSAFGKPFVLSLHGGALPAFACDHPRRVRRLLGAAAAVTAPSPYLQHQMRDYCRGIRVHPNPIDTSQYRFRARPRPAPRLVWVRAFHDLYNPAMAIEAVRALQPHVPGLMLTMAGPDKGDGCWQRTQALVADYGLAAQVHFAGGVAPSAVPALLGGHDIFLNTTRTDNTPVSMLEAMAAGLPVISTRAGGVPYLVGHERDALLVPIGDAAAMARGIERLLGERGLAGRLADNARATADRHDWARVLPLWDHLFRSATRVSSAA